MGRIFTILDKRHGRCNTLPHCPHTYTTAYQTRHVLSSPASPVYSHLLFTGFLSLFCWLHLNWPWTNSRDSIARPPPPTPPRTPLTARIYVLGVMCSDSIDANFSFQFQPSVFQEHLIFWPLHPLSGSGKRFLNGPSLHLVHFVHFVVGGIV